MTKEHRLVGFKALVESNQNSGHYFEDMDGALHLWPDLSPQSKLHYIAGDAVLSEVPFEPFAKAVREVFSALPQGGLEEAALRMVFHYEQEQRELEQLLPDHGRLESPPPLVERFQELLSSQSAQFGADLVGLLQQVGTELPMLLERHNVPIETRQAVHDYLHDVIKGPAALDADHEAGTPDFNPREHGHLTWESLFLEIHHDEGARKREQESGKMLPKMSQAPEKDWGIER